MQFSYVLLSEHPEYIDNFKAVIPARINFRDTGFDGIGAADEAGSPCGIILYDLTPGICTVDWIYVCQDHRRMGVGRGLLTALFTLVGDNISDFEVQFRYICLDAKPDGSIEDTGDLLKFLAADNRLTVRDIYPCMCITADKCHASDVYMKIASAAVNDDTVPFFETRTSLHRTFLTRLEREKKYAVNDYHIWKNTLMHDLCLCKVKDGEIRAAAFIKGDAGNLLVDYLYGAGREDMRDIIVACVRAKEENYPDGNLLVVLYTDIAAQIYSTIFGDSGYVKYMIFSMGWNHSTDI